MMRQVNHQKLFMNLDIARINGEQVCPVTLYD